eukprot:4847797-Lingulodinium_polyedra.AAC.1
MIGARAGRPRGLKVAPCQRRERRHFRRRGGVHSTHSRRAQSAPCFQGARTSPRHDVAHGSAG